MPQSSTSHPVHASETSAQRLPRIGRAPGHYHQSHEGEHLCRQLPDQERRDIGYEMEADAATGLCPWSWVRVGKVMVERVSRSGHLYPTLATIAAWAGKGCSVSTVERRGLLTHRTHKVWVTGTGRKRQTSNSYAFSLSGMLPAPPARHRRPRKQGVLRGGQTDDGIRENLNSSVLQLGLIDTRTPDWVKEDAEWLAKRRREKGLKP
jgi:hypothetical protein